MGNKGNSLIDGHAGSGFPPPCPETARRASTPRQKKDGLGNPGKRATTAEVEERIIIVARMLAARVHKHQIKQYLATKYGLGFRSAEAYTARAREWLLKQSRLPREDFVARAVGFYDDILRDPGSSTREKFDAWAALREMLGLDQPFKVAPTQPDGQRPIPLTLVAGMSMEELAVLRSLHLRAQAARALPPANGNGHATTTSSESGGTGVSAFEWNGQLSSEPDVVGLVDDVIDAEPFPSDGR